ncbi:hypothetical protein PHYBLDRAFT_72855 [Phycomyces blakesleeanus NRRL 1555(-)]|uniref:Uncharacterized protein n=1 Tax=Phycomyces blakesleeanus (strain ATCC 8743b / DSM 1359 / FGSC 10004 / NBRC 33097 / NRRL 1555) TaxID=763407 RepID=A0A167M429_PHYB8|nr:hypothetical protein PHYBLDRAFT_72855 [Phycomyces blakesleeanus NRRL 1555(-)]OAD71729.1 hypothetical protein PHYBLDRAFT_72855 [Phycomyces blakesleeanus NRRL 1555(-)]|eukprot:XP_018289769.1 hypothetical protein PHYBLDRAFT_72855 [Phycomyces blakesleeanus NRRL 1555(-)]
MAYDFVYKKHRGWFNTNSCTRFFWRTLVITLDSMITLVRFLIDVEQKIIWMLMSSRVRVKISTNILNTGAKAVWMVVQVPKELSSIGCPTKSTTIDGKETIIMVPPRLLFVQKSGASLWQTVFSTAQSKTFGEEYPTFIKRLKHTLGQQGRSQPEISTIITEKTKVIFVYFDEFYLTIGQRPSIVCLRLSKLGCIGLFTTEFTRFLRY